MIWSLVQLLRRRIKSAAATTTKRKARLRPWQPYLEMLEDRTVPATSSIASNFNGTAIAPGDTLWFSSVASVTGVGALPATIHVTDQTVTFSDTLGGVTTNYNLSLPNADLKLIPGATSSATTFDTTNNEGVTSVPTGLAGTVFLGGYELPLPNGLNGGDNPVTWTATFTSDTAGLSLNWQWAAAVYTSFSTTYSSLGVKPVDSSTTSIYPNSDHAGTPESYKTHVVGGARGGGGSNYTGSYSATASVAPTYSAPVSFTGTVYNDVNNNGVYDVGDIGIGGITVTLTGTTVGGDTITATTTTASSGSYSFTTDSHGQPLLPGTYQITETPPSGYVQGETNGSLVASAGQSLTYNFANVRPVTLSGLVYQDTNGTGVYTASDPGIAGVTLTLTGTNSFGESVTATSTTAAGGTYSFSTDSSGNLLAPGTYQIVEIRPSGYLLGSATVGTVSGAADGMAVSGTTISSIALAPGQSGINYNFGDVKAVTVSGLVYQDINGTGAYTASDPGIAGVTLTLSGTNNLGESITATTIAAGGGSYSFSVDTSGNALRPGTYQVVETQPSGYLLGSAAVGTVSGIADGTVASATKITTIALTSGQNGINYNFGNVQPVTVSGLVYQDINGTGVYTASDPGIAGVTLTLSGTNNLGQSITATTTTASSGSFSFTTDSSGNSLRPGTYQVVETQPSGYLLGSAAVGTVNGIADGTVASATKITIIALTSGQNGINYNFGDVQPVTVSGLVYQDINGTGVYSASDPGIAAVTLTLGGTNGLGQSITATTTTSANGAYTFSTDSSGNALRPGTYQVVETQPSGYLLGSAAVGTVDSTADGMVASATKITAIALTSGQSGINYLFGDVKQVTVSGTVYVDTNGTGVYGSSDPGIPGVTVTLSGTNGLGQSITATTTTASNGAYSFSTDSSGNALRPGTYQLVETQPSGYLLGSAAAGTVADTADGTVSSATKISAIALTSGQSGINYYFGDVQPVTVSGLVYQDLNGAGVYSSSDPGIAGVTLTLSGTNGLGQSISATTTTATNGTYSFTTDSSGNALRPGTYQIVEAQPSGYLLGAAAVGTVSGTADGTVSSPTQIISISVTSGQNGINYNFGDVLPVTISGLVYQDINGTDVYSSSDPAIAGVTVTLTGFNNLGQAITATTTTASNGAYSFTTDSSSNALRPGTYQVAETQPSGYLLGLPTVGTVNGTTDGLLASATTISSIALTSGRNGINYLFGDVKAVSVSGLVYQDIYGVGSYSSSDTGIAGATLTLSGTNGLGQSITATTTTASNGTYSFTTDNTGNALRPGMYQIVETLPSGFMLDSATVGTVSGSPDGTVSSASKISSIVLTSGQAGINYFFANVKPVSISGLVYQDTNGTGVYNSASDPGIANVTLTLDAVGLAGSYAVATTTTASNGTYSFTTNSSGAGLWPGNYQVVETPPSGYLPGATTVGTVSGTVDGTVVASGTIGSIALTSGQSGINYLFGEVQAVSISGTVYLDSNGNGVFDLGEAGIGGVTVTLSGTNGLGQSITATTTTAANGAYSFSTDSGGNALLPGTYQVAETQPGGYLAGATNVGTVNGTSDGTVVATGHIGSIALTSGQNGINYNFGQVQPITIAGTVYLDANGNGVMDTGDSGFPNVTLTLSGTNSIGQSITATTTSAANGTYSFSTDSNGNLLLPGTYQITETSPSGYVEVAANVGTVNGKLDGSEASPGSISSIAMASGQNGVSYNFGLSVPASVAGYVYLDNNRDGVFNSGDSGLSNITVTLTGTDVLGHSVNLTTTTDATGYYIFTGLSAGTYSIVVTPPGGAYNPEVVNVGTVNNTSDGAANSNLVEIDQVQLSWGNSGVNYNFGLTPPLE
jgi:hypothetical protein